MRSTFGRAVAFVFSAKRRYELLNHRVRIGTPAERRSRKIRKKSHRGWLNVFSRFSISILRTRFQSEPRNVLTFKTKQNIHFVIRLMLINKKKINQMYIKNICIYINITHLP